MGVRESPGEDRWPAARIVLAGQGFSSVDKGSTRVVECPGERGQADRFPGLPGVSVRRSGAAGVPARAARPAPGSAARHRPQPLPARHPLGGLSSQAPALRRPGDGVPQARLQAPLARDRRRRAGAPRRDHPARPSRVQRALRRHGWAERDRTRRGAGRARHPARRPRGAGSRGGRIASGGARVYLVAPLLRGNAGELEALRRLGHRPGRAAGLAPVPAGDRPRAARPARAPAALLDAGRDRGAAVPQVPGPQRRVRVHQQARHPAVRHRPTSSSTSPRSSSTAPSTSAIPRKSASAKSSSASTPAATAR